MVLILASKSKSRLNILKSSGIEVFAQPSEIDEGKIKEEMQLENATVEEIAQALARKKALAISRNQPESTVIGADQILECDGKFFDKARNKAEALEHLKLFRGKHHKLITAVVLAQNGSIIWSYTSTPVLKMRELSDHFLDDYIENAGSALTSSVGAYYLEGIGAQLFSEINGDYHAILGLPLIPLLEKLRELKVIHE